MALPVWLRSALAVLTAGVLVTGLAAPSAQGDPTTPPKNLKDAKAQVVQLETEAAAIEEDYEQAEIQLNEGKRRLKALQADIAAQQAKVDELSAQARVIALRQFQGRGMDTTVELFTQSDPDAFLDRLSTATNVDANLNSTLQDHQSEQANLAALKRAAEAEVAALAAEEERLAKLDAEIEKRLDEAEALVRRMTEEERRQLAARDGARASFNLSELDSAQVSARIKKVIAYAVSRVPNGQYVRGASGPTNFDCSGLMLAAYRQIGISLPHSSRAQARVGRPVSRSELKPGDLIFWYHPIHHVGMYIGNGKIVHARNPRNDLVIQSLGSYGAPWAGARRVIG